MKTIAQQITSLAKSLRKAEKQTLFAHSKQTGKTIDVCRHVLASQIGKKDANKPELRKALDSIHALDLTIGNALVETREHWELSHAVKLLALADSSQQQFGQLIAVFEPAAEPGTPLQTDEFDL